MKLKSIWLQNFRNHENLVVEFDCAKQNSLTVILGEIGSGKTNVLEAIYLLATGKSFRAERVEEMVRWGSEVGRIKGIIESTIPNETFQITKDKDLVDRIELEAMVTRGMGQGKVVRGKQLLVNGVPRLLRNFVGNLKVVLFGPWDMRLIEGSPSRRRGFLDDVLCQTNGEYRRSLLTYEKGVARRNRILQELREGQALRQGSGQASRSQLFFWDQLLLKNGEIVSKERRRFIDFLNQKSGDLEVLYDASPISEQRLKQYEREEVFAGMTLVGPHRDDWRVTSGIGGQLAVEGSDQRRDLSTYGSRGEQRMAILWLKLGELGFMKQECGEQPILLLDDIFSELDHEHREVVMEAIKSCQTVMTAADEHLVEGLEGAIVRL